MTSPNEARTLTPPYLPYSTMTGFWDTLKETAVPPQIDNSVMSKLSGSVKTQMRTGLRFLGAIDENGTVLQPLHDLVSARGTDQWKAVFQKVFLDAYGPLLVGLDLGTGTLQQLKDRFRQAGTEGSVLIKSVRFFLSAIEDTGLKYSPHFKARGLSVGVKSTPRQRAKPTPAANQSVNTHAPNNGAGHSGGGQDTGIAVATGMQRFDLPIKGRNGPAILVVPEDMKETEWVMLDNYLRMFFGFPIKANSGSGS